MKLVISFCLLMLLCSCFDYSQQELKPTKVSISLKDINFNTLQQNIHRDTVFYITNAGTNPLLIYNVETSCGCTTSSWTKRPIKPGKKGEVKVSYDAKYPGRFHKTITVYANIENSQIKLSISGEVEYEKRVLVVNSD